MPIPFVFVSVFCVVYRCGDFPYTLQQCFYCYLYRAIDITKQQARMNIPLLSVITSIEYSTRHSRRTSHLAWGDVAVENPFGKHFVHAWGLRTFRTLQRGQLRPIIYYEITISSHWAFGFIDAGLDNGMHIYMSSREERGWEVLAGMPVPHILPKITPPPPPGLFRRDRSGKGDAGG
ncbi:MAG: hypothetical protein NXY57DRAFT_268595 [Lentinula lateritia]|uniref:Uncharacterized protein n=1 Tax=Lentinula lateritia TaxID=40482 RepID=A0ABQ8VQ99_9AGAR|nr:MAG: hypothetical protein NXY57DRAFT_268595 [Lentinula lateritia]KAJ4498517.1 hypothetical protein C8R41DRAFT_137677 [Lentinula lateritia]